MNPITLEIEENKIAKYNEKEHAFFADLLKSKLHRFHRASQQYPEFKAPVKVSFDDQISD